MGAQGYLRIGGSMRIRKGDGNARTPSWHRAKLGRRRVVAMQIENKTLCTYKEEDREDIINLIDKVKKCKSATLISYDDVPTKHDVKERFADVITRSIGATNEIDRGIVIHYEITLVRDKLLIKGIGINSYHSVIKLAENRNEEVL